MNRISALEATEFLENIISWDALELNVVECKEQIKDVYIPYLMNDAVEYYLCFRNCIVHGDFDNAKEGEVEFSFVSNDSAKGVIIRRGMDETISIWYQDIEMHLHCYKFAYIGHEWRKKRGEDELRRLVNLICVLHDKCTYLGKQYCNELEQKLGLLAEFPPVLMYTPISESILDWYPQSLEGIQVAKEIAEQIGDQKLQQEFLRYEKDYQKEKIRYKKAQKLSEKLAEEKHMAFWTEIMDMMREAEKDLEERDYGEEVNRKLAAMRRQVEEKYRAQGYTGAYPEMVKETEKRTRNTYNIERIRFVEERAFTVLESKGFKYRIFSMKFKGQSLECRWQEEAAQPL